jgi:hypothetical protein
MPQALQLLQRTVQFLAFAQKEYFGMPPLDNGAQTHI